MWATYPKMQEALDLIEAWGFKYKSIAFQWIKQNRSGNGYFFGLGRWTRGNTEPCLIAIKGKPKRISAGVGQLVFSPLRRHSQKPAEVRDKIVELMGDLPRIELFAREAAPDGTCGATKRRRLKSRTRQPTASSWPERRKHMNQTTKETRRRSYDAVLPKRAARCRLILETLGNR